MTNVIPIDPTSPEKRVAIIRGLVEVLRGLQEAFPDADFSEETAECEQALADAEDELRRREWLEQQNSGAVND